MNREDYIELGYRRALAEAAEHVEALVDALYEGPTRATLRSLLLTIRRLKPNTD